MIGSLIEAEAKANTWNRDNVCGRAVIFKDYHGNKIKTVTRTEATVNEYSIGLGLSTWVPMIWLHGIKGRVCLDRVAQYGGKDEDFEFRRVSGDCVCESCGKLYFDHPKDLEHLGQHDIPFLHRLCDGQLVKL